MIENLMTPSQKRHRIKKLDELLNSDGWKILTDLMKQEQNLFWDKMSEPTAAKDEAQYHWNRGLHYGTLKFLQLPGVIINRLEEDLMIEERMKKTTETTEAR